MAKWTTEYADVPGARIAYRQAGRGPAVLLLHGNSESKALFAEYQTKHFLDYRTFALDSRGHGQTESEDAEYAIGGYADDAIAFCRAMGIPRAFVVGYSDGGNIALHLAQKAPEMFPKLAAISPNYLAEGTVESWLRLFRRSADVLTFLGRLGFNTRKARMRFNLMLTDIGLTAEDLRGIRTQVRILYAERDMIKEDHILEIGRLIPGAEVRRIANCDHMTVFKKAEAIQDIRRFFSAA